MRSGMIAAGVSVIAMVLIVTACAGPASAPDTPENRIKSATALATMFADAGSVDRTLGDGAALATESTVSAMELELGRTITDEEEARLSEIMHDVLAEFLTRDQWILAVSEVLSAHFTVAEIDATTVFFKSPAGMKFMEVEEALTKDIDDRVGEAFEQRFDEFAARVDEKLDEAFPALAEGGE